MTVRTSTWRAVAVLVAIQTALVLLAIAGLARADERVSPTLAVLLSAPRFHEDLDEPDEEHEARKREIANAIEAASPYAHERAALLSIGNWESHWAEFIHRDEPKCRDGLGGWCDSGAAWSFWQLHGTNRKGSIKRAARLAILRLRFHARRCGGDLRSERGVRLAFSGFATGNSCQWSDTENLERRVRTWRAYVRRL